MGIIPRQILLKTEGKKTKRSAIKIEKKAEILLKYCNIVENIRRNKKIVRIASYAQYM